MFSSQPWEPSSEEEGGADGRRSRRPGVDSEGEGEASRWRSSVAPEQQMTGRGRKRRVYGKYCRSVPPAPPGFLPESGPITAEVIQVMPNSRAFVVRCFRSDRVFQGICVEQEVSAKATMPRTHFSASFLTGNHVDEAAVMLK